MEEVETKRLHFQQTLCWTAGLGKNAAISTVSAMIIYILSFLTPHHSISFRWPGIVTPDPWSANDYLVEEREGCIYHVEFLGRVRTHLWLPEEMVRRAEILKVDFL